MGRSSLRRISRQPRTWLAALRVGLWVGSIALSVSAEPTRSFPKPDAGTGDEPARQRERKRDAVEGVEVEAPKARNLSLSLNLLQLIGPMAEGTVELRLVNHIGVGAVLGRGKFLLDDSDDYAVWEYGAQINLYSSSFDGLTLSGEALFFSEEGENTVAHYRSTGSITSILAGYKGITSGGFTVLLQIGYSFVDTETIWERDGKEYNSFWLPTGKVNLGFSL